MKKLSPILILMSLVSAQEPAESQIDYIANMRYSK